MFEVRRARHLWSGREAEIIVGTNHTVARFAGEQHWVLLPEQGQFILLEEETGDGRQVD